MFPNTDNRLKRNFGIKLWVWVLKNWILPAPPAMVPRRNLLISITFLTVPEARKNHQVSVENHTVYSFILPTDIATGSCSRVNRDNDSSLEAESQCGSTVLDLDSARGIGKVIRVHSQEIGGLVESK